MTVMRRLLVSLRWLRRFTAVLLFGYDGFISHARADGRPYAIALWTALEQLGLTICFDREDFHAGDPLNSTLRRTVRGSKCLILLDTPRARTSRWVQDEVVGAIAAGRPIVPIQHTDAASVAWQPEGAAAHLATLIHCDETADHFARGEVRFEITDAIRASMRKSSTRQKFRRTAMALAAAAALVAAAVVTASLASSRLEARKWRLADPGIALERALDDTRTFLRSPLGLVARVAFPASVDQLLQDATADRVRLHRLATPPKARVLASAQSLVVLDGTTLDIHGDAPVTRCVLAAPAPLLAAGVNGAGTVVVGVTATSVLTWRVPGCREIAEAPLPPEGAEARGRIRNVTVVGDGASITALICWEFQLLSLALDGGAARVQGRLVASVVADADPAQFFSVAAGAGPLLAFTAGIAGGEGADRLCVATTGSLDISWPCQYETVSGLAISADGDHLVWSSRTSGNLNVVQTSAATERGYVPEYQIVGVAEALAVQGEGVLRIDASGVATYLDMPTLSVLDAQYVGPAPVQHLRGSARRAVYERTTGAADEPRPPAAASCGDRIFDTGSGEAAIRHAGGRWRLTLSEVGLPATATITAAAFAGDCGRLLVALQDGSRSEVLALDVLHRLLSSPRLARRAARTVAGEVRELRLDGTASGWVRAVVATASEPPSLVVQHIPIEQGAVLAWLEGDGHGSRSSLAIVGSSR